MDLQKAKIYLDKITRELARMNKDPENVARIDVDIMQSYIRDLYDVFLSDKPVVAASPKQEAAVPLATRKPVEFSPERPAPKPETPKPAYQEVQPAAPAPQPVVVIEAPRVVAPPPVVEVPRSVAPPPRVSEPSAEVAPAPASPAPAQPAVAKPPITEPYIPTMEEVQAPKPQKPQQAAAAPVTAEAEMLFEQKQARELSEKLAERSIEDLKKGIAINEKLLFIRELFGKDHLFFDEALSTINGLSGFEQAKAWLVANCVGRYDWTDKSRAEHAKDFIRLVRRRFK